MATIALEPAPDGLLARFKIARVAADPAPVALKEALTALAPTGAGSIGAEGWAAWLDDYRAWLGRLVEGAAGKGAVADHVMTLYGLVARFGAILDRATAQSWEAQKASLPPDLEEDEQVAIESRTTSEYIRVSVP